MSIRLAVGRGAARASPGALGGAAVGGLAAGLDEALGDGLDRGAAEPAGGGALSATIGGADSNGGEGAGAGEGGGGAGGADAESIESSADMLASTDMSAAFMSMSMVLFAALSERPQVVSARHPTSRHNRFAKRIGHPPASAWGYDSTIRRFSKSTRGLL
jgi:hypothetical protein